MPVQSPEDQTNTVITTNADKEGTDLVAKLQFEEKMRLVFDEKDSLALKSLQEGVVDFADKRVQIKGASLMEQTTLGSA
jgi:hypothetical protein